MANSGELLRLLRQPPSRTHSSATSPGTITCSCRSGRSRPPPSAPSATRRPPDVRRAARHTGWRSSTSSRAPPPEFAGDRRHAFAIPRAIARRRALPDEGRVLHVELRTLSQRARALGQDARLLLYRRGSPGASRRIRALYRAFDAQLARCRPGARLLGRSRAFPLFDGRFRTQRGALGRYNRSFRRRAGSAEEPGSCSPCRPSAKKRRRVDVAPPQRQSE